MNSLPSLALPPSPRYHILPYKELIERTWMCSDADWMFVTGSWSDRLYKAVSSGTPLGDVRVDGPYGGSLSSYLDQ